MDAQRSCANGETFPESWPTKVLETNEPYCDGPQPVQLRSVTLRNNGHSGIVAKRCVHHGVHAKRKNAQYACGRRKNNSGATNTDLILNRERF